MLIDHIIYAHPDLDAAVAEIKHRFGVLATGGGKHPGRGTHNNLLALGPHTYLEIIAPDPNQPEPSEPRPYGVEGITQGGLVGWAIAAHDIEASLSHARSHGFDPGQVLDGHRVDSTGTLLCWRLTQNASAAGLIPFLINWGDTQHPALGAPAGLVLRSMRLEHPDPHSLMNSLAAIGADVEVIRAPKAALVARIDGPYGESELR